MVGLIDCEAESLRLIEKYQLVVLVHGYFIHETCYKLSSAFFQS